MAHEVLKQPVLTTRSVASRRYLYFDEPPALWMADSKGEDHTAILKASGRTSPTRAGWMMAFSDELQIDASGSVGLEIPTKSATVVYDYIKTLKGRTKQQVRVK
jgi:hypothetical protein